MTALDPDYNPTAGLTHLRTQVAVAKNRPQSGQVRAVLEQFEELDVWLTEGGRQPAQWHRRRLGRKPIETDGDINPELTQSQHGTRGGYNTGCKCMPCRAANRGEDPEVIQIMKEERGWA